MPDHRIGSKAAPLQALGKHKLCRRTNQIEDEDDDENEYDLAGNMLGHSSRCQQLFKTCFLDLHEIVGRFDNTPDSLASGLGV